MDPVQLTSREAIGMVILINLIIGIAFGLIPLLFGHFNKQLKLGLLAIAVTSIGGAIFGVLLSIPATIFFTYLIVRNAKAARAVSSTAETDDPE
ncbi:MAG: hypothetical protein JNL64_05300 [Blastocatellia bacterium]|jgi:ABC-type thiamin/hydroxymethylpyrimidine transport system permease subunit|nr:hypothetical protein [Blastocatellia bacterium]